MERLDQKKLGRLYRAVLSLKTEAECEAFFEDAFTMQEIEALAQRLEVACLLHEGKSYAEIHGETGVSTATICRVNRCLHYGSGGYQTVLERIADGKDAGDNA